MSRKLKSSESCTVLLKNGISSKLNSMPGLKDILLTSSKPKKYIITLKPVPKGIRAESQKVTNKNYALKERATVGTQKLKKVEEKTNSESSKATKNFDLKQIPENISRLSGGWGRLTNRTKKIDGQRNSNTTNKNKQKEADEVVTAKEEHGEFSQQPLPNVVLKSEAAEKVQLPLEVNNSLEARGSDIKNIDPTTRTNENALKSVIPNEDMALSHNEGLIHETVPVSSSRGEIKDSILPSENYLSLPDRYDSSRLNPTDGKLIANSICSLTSEEQICRRIENLEKQVEEINSELVDLQKEKVPSQDLAKLKVLSKHYNEVSDLFAELKVSCLKLKYIENRLHATQDPTSNENMGLNSQNYINTTTVPTCKCKLYGMMQPMAVASKSCGHDAFEMCNCKYLERPNPEYFTRGLERNFINSKKSSCAKYHQNLPQENSAQRSRQPIQQDINLKSDSEISLLHLNQELPPTTFTSRLQQMKQNNPITKSLAGVEYNKYVSTEKATSLDSSSQWNEAIGLTSRQAKLNFLHSKPYQRTFQKSRYSDGRKILSNRLSSSDNGTKTCTLSSTYEELPFTEYDVSNTIWKIIGNCSPDNIVLTVFLESNNLYRINVTVIQTGQLLGCVYTNEPAFRQARRKKLFDHFLVFLVLNSNNTLEQKNKVLRYSFQFINVRD